MANDTQIYNELKKQGVPMALLRSPDARIVKAGNCIYDMDEMNDIDLIGYLEAFKGMVNGVRAIINSFETQYNEKEKPELYQDMLKANMNLTDAIRVFEAEKEYRGL